MCELQNSSFKYFCNFKPHNIFSSQGDIQFLKLFASNKYIIITKPDKGRCVIIVNKNNHINAMQAIISDQLSLFRTIYEINYLFDFSIDFLRILFVIIRVIRWEEF